MEKYKIWLLRLLGAIMAGFAISVFFTPNKIVCGGFSGIAIICFHLFSIPTAVVMMALNVTFLLLGLKILGKSVVINTIIGSSLLTLFVQVFSYKPPIPFVHSFEHFSTEHGLSQALLLQECFNVFIR